MRESRDELCRQVRSMKQDPHCDRAKLRDVVQKLLNDDDREYELKWRARWRDGRKGSRSPSFGKWARDDE